MKDGRGSWYLITGLIIGLAVGLLLSLVLIPVKYVDTEPSTLRAADREAYRSLVARTYLVEADSSRALARLGLLGDTYPADTLVSQAQNLLARNGSQQEARAMALLASALSQPGLVITPLLPPGQNAAVPPVQTTITQTTPLTTETRVIATFTPFVTYTPRPTATPKPTQGPPYRLLEQKDVCGSPEDPLLIQVLVQDSNGNPVPGVKIEITMENAAPAYFYTGLYPEISSGYADYEILQGMTYSLRVGEGGSLITGLSSPVCDGAGGKTFPGGLKLVFQQP